MISEHVTQKRAKDRVIIGDNLWQVGFSYDALYLVRWMSGLVDIKAVICNENGVFFIVNSLDKTGELFLKGVLRGSPLDSVRLPQQSVYVSIAGNEDSTRLLPPDRIADG